MSVAVCDHGPGSEMLRIPKRSVMLAAMSSCSLSPLRAASPSSTILRTVRHELACRRFVMQVESVICGPAAVPARGACTCHIVARSLEMLLVRADVSLIISTSCLRKGWACLCSRMPVLQALRRMRLSGVSWSSAWARLGTARHTASECGVPRVCQLV